MLFIVFVEVEWVVNSRSFIEVSSDVDDFEVLISNYFFIGRGFFNLSFGIVDDKELLSRKRWR